jgi:two-component system OmpR family response regulator
MTPPGSGGMKAAMSDPSPRILVVDDDPGIREVLCDYLGQHGYEAPAVPRT